ncbi:MAG: bifunctional diaminohydroxyphosphoribosylaminopyrimidine deaminase/5-amino-6-(5-phosphoribosylamino)uracil reductase RibD [Gemmatimonadetes bacterium]|nr:bifunctional diaminohydroxyphosphoribosylaminopyrimidine deaminase/5-amino-6-(5-phosphoribosylamino)uracil reductase RibD [Gemmatimonadota bacterium]
MTDVDYMRVALSLAENGRGRVRDGALVGAVAVRDGQVVGKGYYPESGKPHAEVYALEGLADGTPDVTLYVTLEPCAHTGRTPPCVDLLIKRGVARVVCGMVDPDRRVSGRGIHRLREAGVRVEVGVLEEEARRLNEAYVKHRTTGFPFVTLKLAQTLDGRIATTSGESKWISSGASRVKAHGLRAEASAVLVGRGTVEADDPALSVRHVDGPDPAKIVLDSRLEISRDARIFDGEALILAAAHGVSKKKIEAMEECGARVWVCLPKDERPMLRDVLARAGAEGITHVLIEGGGTVAASAMRDRLVDRLAVFIAPAILGKGIDSVGDLGIKRIADAILLNEVDVDWTGPDLFYTARLKGDTVLARAT